MSSPNTLDTMRLVGTPLESSFYGLYCLAIAVHARLRSKKEGGGTNIVIYPLSLLFLLCTVFCAIDIAQTVLILRYESKANHRVGLTIYNINITNTAMYCAITFIAQGILIYRCWLIWDKKLLVISIPFILAWASFGTSLAILGALIEPPSFRYPGATPRSLLYPLSTAAFSVSLAVNATISVLLAIKSLMFIREAQRSFTVQQRRAHLIHQIISILNESGVLMLGCQVIWLVLFSLRSPAFHLLRGSIVMLYGLTPTLIFKQIPPPTAQISQHSSSEDLTVFVSIRPRYCTTHTKGENLRSA